ncbi:unnamed protein product, partial [Linum tenue]
ERIAERIGKPIPVDRATQTKDCGKYARVSIEVDLTKTLLSQFKIEGITYHVEFESFHRICTECGKYGHLKVTCPTLFKNQSNNQPTSTPQVEQSSAPTSVYGEWMMAKPQRKGPNRSQKDKREIHWSDKVKGSCYAVLIEEDTSSHKEISREVSQENQKDKEAVTHAMVTGETDGVAEPIPPTTANDNGAIPLSRQRNQPLGTEDKTTQWRSGIHRWRELGHNICSWATCARRMGILTILSIPLRGTEEQDVLIWMHSDYGYFSAKSGYMKWLGEFKLERSGLAWDSLGASICHAWGAELHGMGSRAIED